jgi:hypothetical protein
VGYRKNQEVIDQYSRGTVPKKARRARRERAAKRTPDEPMRVGMVCARRWCYDIGAADRLAPAGRAD